MTPIRFGPRAERDYHQLRSNARAKKQVDKALDGLASGAANLNIKALTGRPPWKRLRAGDYRLLYRDLTPDELLNYGLSDDLTGYLIARIIHRSELEKAVDTLPPG